MKRRSPAIIGLVALLGMSALVHHERGLKNARRSASRVQKQVAATKKVPEAEGTNSEPSAAQIENPGSSTQTAVEASKTTFHLMPDGTPVPPLADSAPNKIKLGVILFRYKGSQGANSSARSKKEALSLASEALETAKEDFKAAVKLGDRGSLSNIGWMKRRVLERAVEYAVFSLEKGDVSEEPIDTPTGIWVVKRIR